MTFSNMPEGEVTGTRWRIEWPEDCDNEEMLCSLVEQAYMRCYGRRGGFLGAPLPLPDEVATYERDRWTYKILRDLLCTFSVKGDELYRNMIEKRTGKWTGK